MPPEPKTCQSCGRTIEWRKKWERDWDQVRYCSTACRKRGVTDVDKRLEATILDLLAQRARTSTICPSDAARAVGGEGWRELMPAASDRARALARDGVVEVVQKGERLDPDGTWAGPVRIRMTSGGPDPA
jgi:hypothetical protein